MAQRLHMVVAMLHVTPA